MAKLVPLIHLDVQAFVDPHTGALIWHVATADALVRSQSRTLMDGLRQLSRFFPLLRTQVHVAHGPN